MMDDVFDTWMVFCESLRPELDTVCFYPESLLPYPKSLLMEMLADTYNQTKNKDGISELAESIAVNVGYLGRFTNSISEKFLTQLGARLLKIENTNLSDTSEMLRLMKVPATDSKKEMDLLLGFASTIQTYCKLTGFDLSNMISWNGIIGLESSKAVKEYYRLTNG